jgi:hypothetical protein
MCDPDAGANDMCPARVAYGGQHATVFDTIEVKGNSVYWGNNSGIRQGDVAAALAGGINGDDFPSSVFQTALTGFAVGTQYAYFGETGTDIVCTEDHSTPCVWLSLPNGGNYGCPKATSLDQSCVTLGYIEKGAAPPFDSGFAPNAVVIARAQPNAMSFALDGTNVYWTTSRCDINYIADSPQ